MIFNLEKFAIKNFSRQKTNKNEIGNKFLKFATEFFLKLVKIFIQKRGEFENDVIKCKDF